jgi:flagella basal body P-ring formation protein FlgA
MTAVLSAITVLWENRKLVAIGFFVSIVAFFIWNYTYRGTELRRAKAELEATQEELKQYKQNMNEVLKAHKDVENKSRSLEQEKTKLSEKLERRGKVSISKLSSRKTSLMEKTLNKGAQQFFACVNVVSRGKTCETHPSNRRTK